jgi:hypothetical protein
MNLVQDGDTVNIDAGLYIGDVGAWYADNLLIRGVGGMAHLEANGEYAQGKGTWVVAGNNTTIENIEFSGAAVPDQNGAGIRLDGTNITIRHCYFHNNENGILLGQNLLSDVLIEYSEFAYNGFGDGYTHNIYIGNIHSFTIRYSYLHHAIVGHNCKSRARENYILYNRIMDEETGNSSYLLDLPNGGKSFVIGNLFMQGPNTENSSMISYGREGLTNPVNELYFVNNTLVNKRNPGIFLNIQNGNPIVSIINNIFTGYCATIDQYLNGNTTTVSNNLFSTNISYFCFADEPNYNYHLNSNSPAIDQGTDPGMVDSFSLKPVFEYIHPTNRTLRHDVFNIDAGAYEYYDIQTIPLNQGWNLVSSNIQCSDNLLTHVISGIDSNLVIIKNGAGEFYSPESGIDEILNWDITQGYQLYMYQADTIRFIGRKVNPDSSHIQLNQGWNMISYLRNSPMIPATAFASIDDTLVLVKDDLGNIFCPEWFIDNIGLMNTGKGYQIYVSQPVELIYPGN